MIFNQAQKDAIDTIEGPLMVIAGPGTGKTELLSKRVLSILEKTDMKPENILCLTFTDAAASEMRKRLIKNLKGDAHRIEICTFHGFCQKVISDYKTELEIQSLEPISKIEQILIYNSIFDKLKESNPLHNYKNPYTNRFNVIRLNRYLKQENINQDTIYFLANDYLEKMRNHESMYYKKKYGDKKAGDFKQSAFDECIKKSNKIKAATDLCFEYRKILSEKGRYEIDDIIIWTINLFKSNPEILLNYQEQYQYIMVDEFQDNNNTQFELTLLLASYWDVPNLMIVGDDDQSIYRFQGANIENLLDFEKIFSGYLKKVVLTENYRSSQQILNAAETLIKHNKTRLISDKKLVSRSEKINENAKIEITECTNKYYEVAYVIEEIEKLHNDGISYGEIAVIYRNNKESELFQSLMVKRKIPFYLKKKVDIFDVELIKKLVKILNYIAHENKVSYSGHHLLFEILHFDFWEIKSADLAKIAFYIKNNNLLWRDCINGLKVNNELSSSISNESLDKISVLATDLEYWITQSFNVPFIHLIEKIVSKGGILSYILGSPFKKFLFEVLNTFLNFIKDEFHKQPNADIDFFLELMNTVETESIQIETNEIFEKKDAVNLTTAHSSKGLEFEAVFVTGCNTEIWNSKDKENDYLGLKDVLSISDQISINEESRRLFYVACTRAKSYLYLSYNNFGIDKNTKSLSESVFISEIKESSGITFSKFDDRTDTAIDAVASAFDFDNTQTGFTTIESELLNQFTDNYVLSATHLDDYLQCRIMFYYKHVLNIPVVPGIYLVYGNSVHKTLEMFFNSMLKNPEKQYPDASLLNFWFKNEMEKNREFLTQKELENYTYLGVNRIFPMLYKNFINEWNENKNIISESYLKNVVVNDVPIKGKIDLMQFFGNNHVKVIDFKTGKFNSEKSKYLLPPQADNEKNKFGGKYWRQIAFYYLLTNNNKNLNYKVTEGEVIFVEPLDSGEFVRKKIFINDTEIEFMEKLINEVYTNIKSHYFSDGCGEKDCEWCNFNKFYIKKDKYKGDGFSDSEIE